MKSNDFHHAAVSRGPQYNCSNYDQLWYKQSVVNAEGLRVSNPNAGQYSVSKSVNDIEWICQSKKKQKQKQNTTLCS